MTLPRSSSSATVVIADDHALVRNGLKDVIATLPDVEIVGEAENGLEAISLSKLLRPDLLTPDAGMPYARGMEVYGEGRRWIFCKPDQARSNAPMKKTDPRPG